MRTFQLEAPPLERLLAFTPSMLAPPSEPSSVDLSLLGHDEPPVATATALLSRLTVIALNYRGARPRQIDRAVRRRPT